MEVPTADDCPHLELLADSLRAPGTRNAVHREECTQCFDTQDSEHGLDVCLFCFNGGCAESVKHHAQIHADKTQHILALNIKRTPKPQALRNTDEPPHKKLAIHEEHESDKYDTTTRLRCYGEGCAGRYVTPSPHLLSKVENVIAGIMSSMSSAQRSEVKAWEEEIEPCPHALDLTQLPAPPTAPQGMARCSACDLTSNLWLCLTCGNFGCGRQQHGGSAGNGHGLRHFEDCGHPVNVKMGTITAEGTADVYCYACNDARLDPKLQEHLAHFGIQTATSQKTEKSMTELQVEQNMRFDFAMTGEGGRELEPLFGPGLTGLRNLGNSCYLASVLQMLYLIPAFRSRYLLPFASHPATCTSDSAACFDCQMNKVADGLLSGRYSVPSKLLHIADGERAFQDGIKPAMFKTLIGKDHHEFSSMRQQDADEFLRHLLKLVNQNARRSDFAVSPTIERDPGSVMRFTLQQKLQCLRCKGVRYSDEAQEVLSIPVPAVRAAPLLDQDVAPNASEAFEPVTMASCLGLFTQPQEVEYKCTRCQSSTEAHITTKFASFPDYLVIHARRFELVNWVPKKLDVPIILDNETLLLDDFLGSGQQPDETPLPEDEESDEAASPVVNRESQATLEGMGFPSIRAKKALLATGNADVEAAMMWILEHSEDADIDAPLPGKAAGHAHVSPEAVQTLADMGFTAGQARQALLETGGNAERAVEWLFSRDLGIINTNDHGDAQPSGGPTSGAPAPCGDGSLPARYILRAFVSHKGPSVHSGHYVAHCKTGQGPGWVLFNDEKVVRADMGAQSAEKLWPYAYLYLFERQK